MSWMNCGDERHEHQLAEYTADSNSREFATAITETHKVRLSYGVNKLVRNIPHWSEDSHKLLLP